MVDLEFVEWLRLNCTIKVDYRMFQQSNYWWSLNADYIDSWDGEDVKRYTSEEIYQYYLNKVKKDIPKA